MRLVVSCDGAARGNPGPAGIGAVVTDVDGEGLAEVAEGSGRGPMLWLCRGGRAGRPRDAPFADAPRGKSGLHRAGCWVTPRRGDPRKVPQRTDRLRFSGGKGETVR